MNTGELPQRTVFYGVVALIVFSVVSLVGVSIGTKGDATQVATIIAGLVAPVLAVLLLLLRKVEQVHQLTNSTAQAQQVRNEQQAAENDRLTRLIDQLEEKLEAGGG